MNEMVERVARAMCFGYHLNCSNTGCPHAGRCLREFHEKDGLMIMAKAAICEMREPTSAMLGAMQIVHQRSDGYQCARASWQAAVDRALE